jgi:hypothetical protein
MGLRDIFKKKLKETDDKYVFDKAKYHFDSVEEDGLVEEQAYVHTGMFLAWLINNDLVSPSFIEESGDEIMSVRSRQFSPSEIYMNWDGVLLGEMMNNEGFNFSLKYFDFDKGQYLKDYERLLCPHSENLFAAKDTWENYDKLKPAIDTAFVKWKKSL